MVFADLLVCAVIAAVLQQPAPESAKADTVESLTRELYTVAHLYRETSAPTANQVEEWRIHLAQLAARTRRLSDWESPAAQELSTNIRAFLNHLTKPTTDLPKQQPPTGRTIVKPIKPNRVKELHALGKDERLRPIDLPYTAEGGHTEKGVAFLKQEVDRFCAQYRRVKGQDTIPGAETMIDDSRSSLNRTMETAFEVAVEQIAKNSYDPSTIHLSQGVSYNNYSPQKNLQWAFDVATLGIRLERGVGGQTAPWRSWQNKIRGVAVQHGLPLENRVR